MNKFSNQKQLLFLLLMLSMPMLLSAQAVFKSTFALQGESDPFAGRLVGNGMVDLLAKDSLIWAATGYGLNKGIYDLQKQDWNWQVFRSVDYYSKGGVSALGYMDDSTLWIATAFDTTVRGEDLPAGGGLSYTRDNGKTWKHVRQPVDSRDEDRYAPTTTVIQNLTYDIAFIDSTIWIASFGGGLRRSDDMGQNWQVITTDGKFFSSAANLNHRAFSLLSVEDTLWVGTAEGISKSTDNGRTWQRFVFSDTSEQTISGNFVVALACQEFNHTVWAATVQAEDTAEIRAVSKSSDWGKTWQRALVDEQLFAHNFAFSDATVFVPTDQGLYYSEDEGNAWKVIHEIQDVASGDEIFQEEYYSAAVQDWNNEKRLWLGNSDGLATHLLSGALIDWQVIRSFVSTKVRTKPAVYAYPSPFSPSRHLYIRFEYDTALSLDEEIKIYDFGMNEVAAIPFSDLKPKWDGKTNGGTTAASGVYLFRAKVNGKVTWGKIVVIN